LRVDVDRPTRASWRGERPGRATELTQPGGATPLGVVDPLEIPGVAAAVRTWWRLPPVGRVFVALAAIDVLWRLLGIGGYRVNVALDIPISFLWAFAPHNLLILLPALVVLRRPDAATATPLILQGAIAIGLVELLSGPAQSVVIGLEGTLPLIASTILSIAATFVWAAGLLALAIGLLALRPPRPSLPLAGLANLAAGTVAAGVATAVFVALAVPGPGLGIPEWNTLSALAGTLGIIPSAVWAFLVWVVIRGAGDASRPRVATITAAAAAVLLALTWLPVLIADLVVLAEILVGQPVTVAPSSFSLGWFGTGLAMSALAVSFGLGLAGTSARTTGSPAPDARDAAATQGATDAPVMAAPALAGPTPALAGPTPELAWPAPGGDVPVYRPPADPAPAPEPEPPGPGASKAAPSTSKSARAKPAKVTPTKAKSSKPKASKPKARKQPPGDPAT